MPDDLQQALRDLPRVGQRMSARAGLQVWRFELGGRGYYLRFHPSARRGNWLARRLGGSEALREFHRLQWLQKAGVPAPRAVAVLMGFQLADARGDAVIVEGIEPSLQLDRYLIEREPGGEPADHRELRQRLLELLAKLQAAGLGHSDLHAGNFLVSGGRPYLLDARGVHRRGLSADELLPLAVTLQPHASRSDMMRVWRALMPSRPLPRKIPVSTFRPLLKKHATTLPVNIGEWRGEFFECAGSPQRWSPASRLHIRQRDWEEAWPELLGKLESDQFEVIKRAASGDVLGGELVLGGRPVQVIIKRPRRKFWYRYLNEIGRGSRARRAWKKSWQLVVRNIPTAWPLLLMEKRVLGYVTDALIVTERIAGPTLAEAAAASDDPRRHRELLWRCGALLRRLEQTGLNLFDAKAENWMIREDEKLGPLPLIIDVDGLRQFNRSGGLARLLRSLREQRNGGLTAPDALVLAHGYAPFAPAARLRKLAGVDDPRVPVPLFQREPAGTEAHR